MTISIHNAIIVKSLQGNIANFQIKFKQGAKIYAKVLNIYEGGRALVNISGFDFIVETMAYLYVGEKIFLKVLKTKPNIILKLQRKNKGLKNKLKEIAKDLGLDQDSEEILQALESLIFSGFPPEKDIVDDLIDLKKKYSKRNYSINYSDIIYLKKRNIPVTKLTLEWAENREELKNISEYISKLKEKDFENIKVELFHKELFHNEILSQKCKDNFPLAEKIGLNYEYLIKNKIDKNNNIQSGIIPHEIIPLSLKSMLLTKLHKNSKLKNLLLSILGYQIDNIRDEVGNKQIFYSIPMPLVIKDENYTALINYEKNNNKSNLNKKKKSFTINFPNIGHIELQINYFRKNINVCLKTDNNNSYKKIKENIKSLEKIFENNGWEKYSIKIININENQKDKKGFDIKV